MKLEDMFENQPVALIKSFESYKKGLIGYAQGYSNSQQKCLVRLVDGTEIYVPVENLIGVL